MCTNASAAVVIPIAVVPRSVDRVLAIVWTTVGASIRDVRMVKVMTILISVAVLLWSVEIVRWVMVGWCMILWGVNVIARAIVNWFMVYWGVDIVGWSMVDRFMEIVNGTMMDWRLIERFMINWSVMSRHIMITERDLVTHLLSEEDLRKCKSERMAEFIVVLVLPLCH